MITGIHLKTAFCCLCALICETCAYAAPKDSLTGKDYSYLFRRIKETKDNTKFQQLYLKAFLDNAKAGTDFELLIQGYKNYVDNSEGTLKIIYTDSMVKAALKSNDDKLIGSAYLSRGIVFYGMKKHQEALENYIAARTYLERADDPYLSYKLKYNIAQEKYYLGQNQETIELLTQCLTYFKDENTRAYLNTIHSLGLAYNKSGDYGNAARMVSLGVGEAKRLNNHNMDCYFLHLDGLNEYFTSNYASAIAKLKQSIVPLTNLNDYANLAVANFYIGKSYWAQKNFRESIPYLKKVDDEFIRSEYIRPDLRENYELLIDYYKDNDNQGEVLKYVDRLLKADSILRLTHDHLFDSIHKNYDDRELLLEKQRMEKALYRQKSNNNLLVISSISLLAITLFISYRWKTNRKRQEKIFKELMQENQRLSMKPDKSIPKELAIPEDTVLKVLQALKKWEANKEYLKSNTSLTALAEYVGANNRYTSEIISFHKKQSYNNYVNSLKIQYIINALKKNRLLRIFTDDALAAEVGFTSTQRFVAAFKAYTEMSPRVFIEKLRKELDNNAEPS